LVDVVFTIKGDNKTAKPFEMSFENVIFDNKSNNKLDLAQQSLKAFPNPATEVTDLTFEMSEDGDIQIALFNYQGKQIINRTESVRKGINRVTIPVLDIPRGIYIATVTTGKDRLSTKVIVP
jgi:hypothetical protein